MGRKDIFERIPTAREIRRIFEFIGDPALRDNTAITFRYVIFLLTLQELDGISRGTTAYSLNKDIVLHCASIVEGLLHYSVKVFLDSHPDSGLLDEKWVDVETRMTVSMPDLGGRKRNLVGVIREQRVVEFKASTDFEIVIRIARRARSIGKRLENKCQELRKMRNKIHLSGLVESNDYFFSRDVDFAIDTLVSVVQRTRENLERSRKKARQ